MTVRAIYENGVFTPIQKVDLPDKAVVTFEPQIVSQHPPVSKGMGRIYEIMSRTYDTGDSTIAARHDEHQP